MTVTDLLLPVFVEVGLTFFLMFWMGLLRREALNSGAVKPADINLRQQRGRRGRRRSPTASTISSSCRSCSTC